MLVYLDANLVQYCADYADFIFGGSEDAPSEDPKLVRQLRGLRDLTDMEQLGTWGFAGPQHLLAELRKGRPTRRQLDTYEQLERSWAESGLFEDLPTGPVFETIER